ncbi:tripartite tricarboxylate transporter TctB family protein [Fusibacter paucivorans]|uniref:Tripartite tricarboxylate transporter TctB family protein n=1 Tax=Fusibacter paucivorans TaxID=76009 RepID=A0ABS5PL22_9FIRM|nr:tripartite tricarboxylate transporter TctB family protein [Fusibacter paucivorans]MBS7525271.1 tripartite tricarboxylate transporter TctB family protein [Fusibacter paucivorans]
MEIKESSVEKYGGIVIGLLTLLLYFWVIPSQIGHVKKVPVEPQTLPKILAIIMFVLSIALSVTGHLNRHKANQKVYKVALSEMKLVFFSLGVLIVYTVVVSHIGYMITTVASLAALMYAFGQRNRIKLIGVSVLVPLGIMIFFTKLMQIHLP